jgi:hypothetical protein
MIQVVNPARKSPRTAYRKQRTRVQPFSNTRHRRSGALKRANLLDETPRDRFERSYKKVVSIRRKHLRRELTTEEKRSLRRSVAKQANFEEEIFDFSVTPNASTAQFELVYQQLQFMRNDVSELRESLARSVAFQRCSLPTQGRQPVVQETAPFNFVQVYYEGAAAQAAYFLANTTAPTNICSECIQRRLEFLDLTLPYLSDYLERNNLTAVLGNEHQWTSFTHNMGWRLCNESKRKADITRTALEIDAQAQRTIREKLEREKKVEEDRLYREEQLAKIVQESEALRLRTQQEALTLLQKKKQLEQDSLTWLRTCLRLSAKLQPVPMLQRQFTAMAIDAPTWNDLVDLQEYMDSRHPTPKFQDIPWNQRTQILDELYQRIGD